MRMYEGRVRGSETGGGKREEGIGERRSRRAIGPVPPRSHVRPYNTRNTCNTDNTCNTCVTHYTPARQRPAGSPAAAGDDDRSYLRVLATSPRLSKGSQGAGR